MSNSLDNQSQQNTTLNFTTFRRYQPKMIGNVYCYWYNKNTSQPRITIGPTWMFAVPVFIAALVMLFCFIQGLLYMNKIGMILKSIAFVMIGFNLQSYFYTLLGNQGLPKELFIRQDILATQGDSLNASSSSSSSNNSRSANNSFKDVSLGSIDMENGYSSGLQNRRCEICDIRQEENDYHCRACAVCVRGYHHHCVFFSKCIGEGNTQSFFHTLILLVVLTCYYTALVILEQVYF
ncbi:probable palmitoyltransferase zdhhc23 [Stylonychia lemnae]|uniref:Palmitoyltransferase n=1 Tax=Stylonychia lemnae TaxID=5949 RepID=A0A078ALU0_STYLE|nr:probable palmitoyltransferase zdhhc23 [Stylonychia lemnae]|eukprot:CDW82846.1 probable palmitoyltransferase zdhhc23 [Stylonychia lemnae]